MRHRIRGRKLGRNASHRKAMLRNMACSLIHTVRVDPDDSQKPQVAGRIVTTLAKAKELRPFVEKLVTLARRAIEHEDNADQYAAPGKRNTDKWKAWRQSDDWNRWNQAIAPAVALRRRAFAALRDETAVDILFDELAEQFESRNGGYTRVVRLPSVRLGDAGQQAFIEFVIDAARDRARTRTSRAPVVDDDETAGEEQDAAAGDEDDEDGEGDDDTVLDETAESSGEEKPEK